MVKESIVFVADKNGSITKTTLEFLEQNGENDTCFRVLQNYNHMITHADLSEILP